jgi:hypothetical protein
MTAWALAKQATELNWRDQWAEIAAGTTGEQPAEVLTLLTEMSRAHQAHDRVLFITLKARLVNQPSWRGLKPTCADSLGAGSEKPTAPPTQVALPI